MLIECFTNQKWQLYPRSLETSTKQERRLDHCGQISFLRCGRGSKINLNILYKPLQECFLLRIFASDVT